MWKVPAVVWAIAFSVALSAGTGIRSPSMSTVPLSVPNAIVDTGTLASAAASAAASGARPVLEVPSLISTIRAGGGWSPLEVVALLNVLIASRQEKTASPMAVAPVQLETVDGHLDGVAVDRRWNEHARRSAELDQAEVDAGRKKVSELLRRLLRGL